MMEQKKRRWSGNDVVDHYLSQAAFATTCAANCYAVGLWQCSVGVCGWRIVTVDVNQWVWTEEKTFHLQKVARGWLQCITKRPQRHDKEKAMRRDRGKKRSTMRRRTTQQSRAKKRRKRLRSSREKCKTTTETSKTTANGQGSVLLVGCSIGVGAFLRACAQGPIPIPAHSKAGAPPAQTHYTMTSHLGNAFQPLFKCVIKASQNTK